MPQPSKRRLSEVARHVVIPDGIVTTAWPRIVAVCAELGVMFDEWQHGIGKVALGKRKDGKYAATVGGVVLSIPRQVGKTFLVGMIIIALCLLHPGLTVLWSAHRTRTATKTFGTLKGMTSRRKVKAHMLEPRNANGEQEIRFRNGSVIMFGAREQGFGRGFDEVDIEVFDEAQILTEKALEDMVAATNQSRRPEGALLFFMGTPPRPTDPGEEFLNRRKRALAVEGGVPFEKPAVGGNMVYVEFSADRGAKLDDRKQVAKANPSYPDRTPQEAIDRMRENLTNEASFRREALGIWDDIEGATRLIAADEWSATGVPEPPAAEGVKTFGIAFSLDGSRVAVAGGLKHPGGIHVELVGAHSGSMGAGVASLADWLAERKDSTALYAISGQAGAAVLAEALISRGVPRRAVHVCSSPDYFASTSMFVDAVREASVTHLAGEGQAALDDSVAVSDKELVGKSGSWRWKATTPDGDDTPVEAVSLAHWAAKTTKRRPGRKVKAVVL